MQLAWISILEYNWRWFGAIDYQSDCIWYIRRLVREIEGDSQVLGVKSDIWKVWKLKCTGQKLALNQLWTIEECSGLNYDNLNMKD